MIRKITPRNFLSFGPDHPGVELQALNVLIGPNGSGKSNLIEAVSLMRSSPKDFQTITRKGGGVSEWIWKGSTLPSASIDIVFDLIEHVGPPIRHAIKFQPVNQSFQLVSERIEGAEASTQNAHSFFRYENGEATLATRGNGNHVMPRASHSSTSSILAQRRDPDAFPELAQIAGFYEGTRLYREWNFGLTAPLRQPQAADFPSKPLAEDFSNLALFLNYLQADHPKQMRQFLEALRDLYSGISDFGTRVQGNTILTYITEGDYSIPSNRLSDGTLRYLCLLAVIFDPEPPPLVCIEEPELGLHPDVIAGLVHLLKEFSRRTQLIITTHSEAVVDALHDYPAAIIACGKKAGSTTMERLDAEDLRSWLDEYRLGTLWKRGDIGGNRW